MGRTVLLALALLACGCPGEADPSLLTDGGFTDADGAMADGEPKMEGGAPDGQPDQSPSDSAVCTPEDAVTSCNPVTGLGCPSGSGCYIVKGGSVVDCICPAGSGDEGSPCNATAECLPGYGCAGTQAPGACRQMCDPTAPICPPNQTCTTLNTLPQFGICGPQTP